MTLDVAQLVQRRATDEHCALRFEDQQWSYREFAAACAQRANRLLAMRREGPFHVGVLLDNVPEYPMLLGAAALAGATVVGLNPTRRGRELERDARHAECQLLITEPRHSELLEGLELPFESDRVLDVESPAWSQALTPHTGKPVPEIKIDTRAPYLLLFTSGTTGDPKAAVCSQGRLALIGEALSGMRSLTERDVSYLAMPMFHSNALMAGWAPALAAGMTTVLRRKFSASGFLPDVRRYGVTYFSYVGKPLTYILATPARDDDRDNPLQVAFGNEGPEHDLKRFAERFGCEVIDSYGSTEGGISISRTPDTPGGALGIGQPGTLILDPESGEECPPARFDADGRLANADDAVGEIANRQSATAFEGYWNNQEADHERTRQGIYWSGDLGYRDEAGFLYFAGRNFDWLRVDGENFAAAPIERILVRHPEVSLAAVYAVPNSDVGDDVMAALVLTSSETFDADEFERFLAAQADLGTKWAPRYLRVAQSLPSTQTNKILKRALREERWECADPVWIRGTDGSYRALGKAEVESIREAFRERSRESELTR